MHDVSMYCNVNLRKLLSGHKNHARETSLFTGATPNQVRNSQTLISICRIIINGNVCLYVCLPVCLSMCVHKSLILFIRLSFYLSVCLSSCWSMAAPPYDTDQTPCHSKLA